MNRRTFLTIAGSAVAAAAVPSGKPNILWVTCEDIGPHIGPYGDTYATTPNLDLLGRKSTVYRNAWSNAPVCAPARTTIISGLYPPSTGAEHMRSMTSLPSSIRMFPCHLRDAGYYTSNNVKEDYNLEHTGTVWDESSNKAHWRKRKEGQPFFSVFNFIITHESQLRTRPHTFVHDPAKVRLPAYHPDTPEVRLDWAQYYDNITTMDTQVGEVLKQLEDDKLAEDTIVFFYGDHGSGMPRSKRWPYNSGLQVPLLVHVPEKWKHLASKDYRSGGDSQRLVSFVDLAPTLLSLAGIAPPATMQGAAFLGPKEASPRKHLFGFRGRMDERLDLVRSARNERFVYIRNFMPHKIYGQHLAYMFETPTTRIWRKLYDDGKLHPPQTFFWERKPVEELYDLQTDKDEVRNLAGSPEHAAVMKELRQAVFDEAVRIRDVGFLPENEIHSRSAGSTPYEMGHNEKLYPMRRVLAAANAASTGRAGNLADTDSAVRYWAITGLIIKGKEAVAKNGPALEKALADPAPSVRIAAGEALGAHGTDAQAEMALPVLLALSDAEKNGVYTAVLALNAIDAMGDRNKPIRAEVAKLPRFQKSSPQRTHEYAARMIEEITGAK